MGLSISNKRKAVVVSYLDDDGSNPLQGDSVSGVAQNGEDVGSRSEQNNDGEFVWFFPADFTNDAEQVTLTGSDGGEVTGTVTIS